MWRRRKETGRTEECASVLGRSVHTALLMTTSGRSDDGEAGVNKL